MKGIVVNMNKKILTLLLISIFFFSICGCESSKQIFNSKTQTDLNMINKNDMKEDLDCLYDNLVKTHPEFKDAAFKKEYDKFYKGLYKKIKHPLKYEDFYFIIISALTPLKDGHTYAYYHLDQRYIPLEFIWTEADGMIISKDNGRLKKGDKIISISNKTPEDILKSLKNIISAENDYWIKYRAQSFLPSDIFLRKLGLIQNDKVSIRVEHINGLKEDIDLNFNGDPVPKEPTLNKYEIIKDKGIAVLHLNELINDKLYSDMLDDFFKEVKDNNIKTIVIDLRHCNGGDSGTLNTFLTYLNIHAYKPYVMENMQNLLGIEQYNNNKENINYNGDIYVMTSPATFSSAVIFAETLKVNKIGTAIGEPAGNAPTHYGAPETIGLPHYFNTVCISTLENISPDNNRTDKFLKPDIYIPLTRDDIAENIDPVMKWLENNK